MGERLSKLTCGYRDEATKSRIGFEDFLFCPRAIVDADGHRSIKEEASSFERRQEHG